MEKFPVMQYETKYGIDYRVGATEANTRSGSKLVGYIEASSKQYAISILKSLVRIAVRKIIQSS